MADTSKKADKGKKTDDKAKKADAPPAEVLNINELGAAFLDFTTFGTVLTRITARRGEEY
jgi:hypothetical protein